MTKGRKSLPTLEERVRQKRDVLRRWLTEGVPPDKLASIPQSLTEARLWEDTDPDWRVYRIGSPNSFTKGNDVVGELVAEIAGLLTRLRNKVKKPTRVPRAESARSQKISVGEIEAAFSAMASQWHKTREELRKEKERATTAENLLAIITREKEEQDKELADLRRRLQQRLTLVQ